MSGLSYFNSLFGLLPRQRGSRQNQSLQKKGPAILTALFNVAATVQPQQLGWANLLQHPIHLPFQERKAPTALERGRGQKDQCE